MLLSTAVPEVTESVDWAVVTSLTVAEALDVVDSTVDPSKAVDVSAVDGGSKVVDSVAEDETPDIVLNGVLISADNVVSVEAVVSTPVTSVTADVPSDKGDWDVVTSSDTELPDEAVESVVVTPSVDMSTDVDSVTVVSVTAGVPLCVDISKVLLAPSTVVSTADVENEAVVCSDIPTVPASQMIYCFIDFAYIILRLCNWSLMFSICCRFY